MHLQRCINLLEPGTMTPSMSLSHHLGKKALVEANEPSHQSMPYVEYSHSGFAEAYWLQMLLWICRSKQSAKALPDPEHCLVLCRHRTGCCARSDPPQMANLGSSSRRNGCSHVPGAPQLHRCIPDCLHAAPLCCSVAWDMKTYLVYVLMCTSMQDQSAPSALNLCCWQSCRTTKLTDL